MSKGHCHYAQVGIDPDRSHSLWCPTNQAFVHTTLAAPLDLRLPQDKLHFSPLESEVRKGRGPGVVQQGMWRGRRLLSLSAKTLHSHRLTTSEKELWRRASKCRALDINTVGEYL